MDVACSNRLLWCTRMLMDQTQVALAEAPRGLPAPTFGSDSEAGFIVVQIIYVHLISTQIGHYSD